LVTVLGRHSRHFLRCFFDGASGPGAPSLAHARGRWFWVLLCCCVKAVVARLFCGYREWGRRRGTRPTDLAARGVERY